MPSKKSKILYLESNPRDTQFDHLITGLVKICNDLDFEIIRYREGEWEKYENFEEFATRFKKDIDEADCLMSQGYFRWLQFFGDTLDVATHFENAIKMGKPFIFQGPRAWEAHYQGPLLDKGNKLVQKIYKLLGLRPTKWRVFTRDAASPVGGGSVAYFRSGDNCFLNADIFGDIDSIVIKAPNIVSYESGVYPIVETGVLHYLTCPGDIRGTLETGLRPAVFVEIKNKDMKGFFISGNIFLDGYENLQGTYIPGIENNEMVVRALLEKVSSWDTNTQSSETAAYKDLFDLEKGLAEILLMRLPNYETALLAEAQLKDLIELGKVQWSNICDLFDYKNVEDFSKALAGIPAGARNYLCHPVKSEFKKIDFDGETFKQLSVAAEKVRVARGKLNFDNDENIS